MMFKDKLYNFKYKGYGLHIKTAEIAKLLAKILDNEDIKDSNGATWLDIILDAYSCYGDSTYIGYLQNQGYYSNEPVWGISYDITLGELKEYKLMEDVKRITNRFLWFR